MQPCPRPDGGLGRGGGLPPPGHPGHFCWFKAPVLTLPGAAAWDLMRDAVRYSHSRGASPALCIGTSGGAEQRDISIQRLSDDVGVVMVMGGGTKLEARENRRRGDAGGSVTTLKGVVMTLEAPR